jgi:hypothetical protein
LSTEKVRILICMVCNTIESFPDYSGPPQYDYLLENLLSRHEFDSGTRHVGHLGNVLKNIWDKKDTRDKIVKQIREGTGGLDELDKGFYDVKDTFREDALHCWTVKHNRTTDCGDYKSESKRLLPDTKDDWKQLGIKRPAKTSFDRYLCNFCPYESVVMEIEKHKRGLD